MSWKSEKLYPGGIIVYEPMSHCDKYYILYRSPYNGTFYRGVISHFDLVNMKNS